MALACGSAADAATLPEPLAGFIQTHCAECHDADVRKGGLNLEALGFELSHPETRAYWVRVFDRVHEGEMPPPKSDQPSAEAVRTFLAGLEKDLITADAAEVAAQGRVRSRRLTRVEYEHTVQDLLGIDLPLTEMLPEDPAAHGFQTVAEAQQLSHFQLARYLDAADRALDAAFDRVLKEDKPFKRWLTPEQLARNQRGNYRGPDVRNGLSVTYPIQLQFFGRMKPTEVPADGWYRVTLKQVRAVNPPPGGVVWGTLRSGTCYSDAPVLYLLGLVEATTQPRDFVFEGWIQQDHMLELRPNDATLKKAPTGAKGGNVSFKNQNLIKQGFPGIAHRGIEIERIHPVADRSQVRRHLYGEGELEALRKEGEPALERLVASFARRAFRRPVTTEQLAPYLVLGLEAMRENGAGLDAGLKAAYRAVLCSPRFLTLVEAPGELDDHALAARLSYALWLSLPDPALAALADAGRLRDPQVLAAEVERLLADRKAERFLKSFTDQWLKLSQIDFTSPDPKRFRSFDPVLQESMVRETRAYVAEMLKEDLGIAHLLDSDFVLVNERLARHYGLDTTGLKPGEGVQKVALPGDSVRGGLPAQGAILKVTADGSSTSPVVRGVFVNERLLGRHIPPPPPGVPAIEPDIRGATSIRDQLDKHRSNESCRACHAVIDPPGFALESFDPVGAWRTRYGPAGGQGVRVDPSGTTPEGQAFANLEAWRRLEIARADRLARGFAAQFLTYATGAPPRFSDRAALGAIAARTADSGHGLRSVVREAVLSSVFRRK